MNAANNADTTFVLALNCPECGQDLTNGLRWKCPEGHEYEQDEGVIRLLKPEMRSELDDFESVFAQARKAERYYQPDPKQFEELPFGPGAKNEAAWKLRQKDLEILPHAIRERTGLAVLEVGGWNGWLSHRLSQAGQNVVAVDYFMSEIDGLKARNHYTEANWTSIQMDLRDLSIIQSKFDVVIFNHCLHFFPDPQASFAQAKNLLNPGGKILILGMPIYSHPYKKEADFKAEQAAYKEKYGRSLLLFPAKGFYTIADHGRFLLAGLRTRPYPGRLFKYLAAIIKPHSAWTSWGIWPGK